MMIVFCKYKLTKLRPSFCTQCVVSFANNRMVAPWYRGKTCGLITRGLSSNPARVTIKIPLARKATVNHLIKSTFLEETQSPLSLVSATLEFEVCNTACLLKSDSFRVYMLEKPSKVE